MIIVKIHVNQVLKKKFASFFRKRQTHTQFAKNTLQKMCDFFLELIYQIRCRKYILNIAHPFFTVILIREKYFQKKKLFDIQWF